MFNFPDLRPLFYFAMIGVLFVLAAVIGAGGWVIYHIVRALLFYTGAL
ncbi:hypothetical protein V5F79_22430 [Xanthobacter flavus]